MEKLYNENGQVAVAVSKNYGAGWSTWNKPELCLDKRYNELILNKKFKDAEELAKTEGYYPGGIKDCIIKWVDSGDYFRITEYDGFESFEILDVDSNYTKA